MRDQDEMHDEQAARRAGWLAALTALLVVGVFAIVLWSMGFMRGRGAFDQHYYHIKAIQQFAQELPTPNLKDYLSATSPGYHLVLAPIARWVSDRPVVLQIAGSAFSFVLLGWVGVVIGRAAYRRGVGFAGCVLVLPVACSPYVLNSGVWLLPDNAGWLGVWAILMLALAAIGPDERKGDRRRAGMSGLVGWRLGAAALVLAALVFTRQSHLWAAGLLWAAAWLSMTRADDGSLAGLTGQWGRRSGALGAAMVATLPAVGVLAWLLDMWGGLTPPQFQDRHASALNLATPAFMLSLLSIYSAFFVGWLWPGLTKLWREYRLVLGLLAILGFVLGIVPTTTYLQEPRSSGLWNLVRVMEGYGLVIVGRSSPILIVGSVVGSVCVGAWLVMIEDRRRWLMAAAVVGFIAAQTASTNCWQRYHEPFLLMLIGYMAAMTAAPAGRTFMMTNWGWRFGALRVIGPLILAGILLALMVHGLATGETMRWG